MNKLDMESCNIIKENINKISKIFPNVMVETTDGVVIDFDKLKQELSMGDLPNKKEKYQLTWPGKIESTKIANLPINKTLRPLKDKSINYESTENIYIEGDNLDTLKLLQESYLNKIKCIYIDPPYNTGTDFVYNDDFTVDENEDLISSGQIDELGNRLVTNQKSSSRYHSKWLSMIYPRLKLSRNLLSEDGIIFISIDDNELNNVITMCSEIFGENNFIGVFPRITKKSGKAHSDTIAKNNDYIVIFSKYIDATKFNGLDSNDKETGFTFEDEFVAERGKYKLNQTLDYDSLWYNPTMDFPINVNGETYYPGGSEEKHKARHNGIHNSKDWVWRWSQAKFDFGYQNGFVVIKEGKDRNRIYTKTYENATISKDEHGNYFVESKERKNIVSSLTFVENEFSNDNAKKELSKYDLSNVFDFSKPSILIEKLIELIDNEEPFIVLDFFSGSGTTAEAVMRYNAKNNKRNKFIMVQLPENNNNNNFNTICEIGEERIKRAGIKIKEETNVNIDYGYRVYKVDSSNMKDVYYKPNELSQLNLLDYMSNIKEDRTADDLLTQVMLDLGLTLDLKIEKKSILNNSVYFVENNSLIACFDDNVNIDIIDEICKYNPLKVVFKDVSFRTDKDKINLEERIKKLSPETEISIL